MKPCSSCGGKNKRKGQRYCRLCHNAYCRENNKKYKDFSDLEKLKVKCRSMTAWLVKSGKLLMKNICSSCNSTKNIERHHTDYNDPYKFDELCRTCHKLLS